MTRSILVAGLALALAVPARAERRAGWVFTVLGGACIAAAGVTYAKYRQSGRAGTDNRRTVTETQMVNTYDIQWNEETWTREVRIIDQQSRTVTRTVGEYQAAGERNPRYRSAAIALAAAGLVGLGVGAVEFHDDGVYLNGRLKF
jgi:uncharacterized protein YlxW (UPF0749 family)